MSEDQKPHNSMTDWLASGRDYLANNAAENGADVIIAELCDEVGRLRQVMRECCDSIHDEDDISALRMLKVALNGR